MKVLITGGGGMLGRDVALAAREVNHEPIALGHDELDITDPEAVERAVIESNPGAVVNCAAWTDVDGAETNEDEACLLYTSPSPRDRQKSRMPSSA